MPYPPLVDFVDSISASPTVRLRLNDGTIRRVGSGADFSPPQPRRAIASTMLVDGERVAADAYPNRVITLPIRQEGGDPDTAASLMQALHRELDRPTNILRVQFGSTPVFFRTYRSPGYQLSVENGLLTTTGLGLELLAEPFAYGLAETAVNAVSVPNNPASAGGCVVDVTGVKGDVDTPAVIECPTVAMLEERPVLATRRRGTPGSLVWLAQAESLTVGTDTALGAANDAAFSGAGQNYMRTTFATNAAMATRLSAVATLPSPAAEAAGTYRVFARVRPSVGTDTLTLAVRLTSPTSTLYDGPAVTVSGTAVAMVDLGVIQVPLGGAAAVGVDPLTGLPQTSETPTLVLRASRTGTGVLDWDYVAVVPADTELAIVGLGTVGGEVNLTNVFDAATGAVYRRRTASGARLSGDMVQYDGGLPMLSPAPQATRIYLLRRDSAVTASSTVTVRYLPRYLAVS